MKKFCYVCALFILFLYPIHVWGQTPESYMIDGFVSHARTYQLDSEAQTASDLASFYGYAIEPMSILNALPLTDDPNPGFVGYYDDAPSLPPNSYGVYQEPLAEVLQAQGIPAIGLASLGMDGLKNYLRSGIPVMCWVIGQTQSGNAISYTPSSGKTTTVAQYMNTVTVVGYDGQNITIWDNGQKYNRPIAEFESSWSVLGYRNLVIDNFTEIASASIEPAAQNRDWWNDSLDDWWQADKNIPDPQGWNSELGKSDFGIVPEVTPDFSWSDETFDEDYSNWFWYSEENAGDTSFDNASQPVSDFGDFSSYEGMFPASASVTGFIGYPQSYTLDCETRSAVDLAAFYGITIDPMDFLSRLPKSDDPNEGFVGNYWDPREEYLLLLMASIKVRWLSCSSNMDYPPSDIKITPGNNCGKKLLPADRSWHGWQEIQKQVLRYPIPHQTANTTKVVPYQHTVVVIGYDEMNVTIQDGGQRYTRNINTFLLSWQTLENRVIIVR
jgi:uncharacterized protein YvpB